MPLIAGLDARGRPVYDNPVSPTAPVENKAAKLQQALDNVDPGPQPQQSTTDYSFMNNRNNSVKQQGVSATASAQQAAQAAMTRRLTATQAQSYRLTPGGSLGTSGGAYTGSTGGTDLRSRLIARVASQQGVDYRWGGSSPRTGFDCSGLVQWAYARLGIRMPHSSGSLSHMGVRTSIGNLRPGDLVAHPGHIAIYAGNGMMWEAPHTGAQVRLVRVRRNMYGVHLTLPGD